jgi:hypothetical protein
MSSAKIVGLLLLLGLAQMRVWTALVAQRYFIQGVTLSGIK